VNRTEGNRRDLRADILFAFGLGVLCYLAWLLRHVLLLLFFRWLDFSFAPCGFESDGHRLGSPADAGRLGRNGAAGEHESRRGGERGARERVHACRSG